MKDVLSVAAVFEFSMFGIMVLFLSFCGFFTFKHCFFIWRRKKRGRPDDSLESILDLLYNEDYYYLESGTPYLPPPEVDSSSQKSGGSTRAAEGDSSQASFASAPSQGRSVKWKGSEGITVHEYKVCPQTSKPEQREMIYSHKTLRRQPKFQASTSPENVLNQAEQSTVPNIQVCQLPNESAAMRPHLLCLGDDTTPNETSPPDKISPTARHKTASVSIRNVVTTSKFIGASHRAKKQLRMQSRFQPGTFRYRDDVSPDGSFEKRISPSGESEFRPSCKKKVNFVELSSSPHDPRVSDNTQDSDTRDDTKASHSGAHTRDNHGRLSSRDSWRGLRTSGTHEHHHKGGIHSEERSQKIGSPFSAFRLLPSRRGVTGSFDSFSGSNRDNRTESDVEKLYQQYERLEKTRYSEMLKKAKSLRRENFSFFNRKHNSS